MHRSSISSNLVLLVGVAVRLGRMLVSLLTVLVRGRRVLFRLLVLSLFVMMSRLEMVMGGRVVFGGGLMMMFRRRMLGLVGHS